MNTAARPRMPTAAAAVTRPAAAVIRAKARRNE